MNSKLKVLHILNHSYPFSDGYAIRSFNIVNAQRKRGLEPIVLTSPKHEPRVLQNPETIEGTRYYRSKKLSKERPIVSNGYVICVILREIFKIYKEKTCYIPTVVNY